MTRNKLTKLNLDNMRFKPTEYQLMNVETGRVFDDGDWTLSDPMATEPALVRAVYKTKQFAPVDGHDGLYRYSNWMPIKRMLKDSHAPVTYKSRKLSKLLGMDNLYITFSGYYPNIGALMTTCSFKETEAYSVCARLPKNNGKVLVVQSAGNTARAFARVCSDNNIPIVICIPEDNKHDMWFTKRLKNCVKIVATPSGSDYFDAITLGEKLCTDPMFLAEGGAKNVARRDGMGTTLLSAVETIGRIPDAYFQAVGSGTGAIAAYENNLRLIEDGRFGKHLMKIFVSQNEPFTLMYDSWKAGSRALVDYSPEQSRRDSEVILAKVLSNRKPPYSIKGGLYDTLKATGGDMYTVTNDEIVSWIIQYFQCEGYDIFPAAATAVASVAKALKDGKIKSNDTVMLNVTGGGMLIAKQEGFFEAEPALVLSPELPADIIVSKVKSLF